ncbi:MAG: hypothetical protein ABIH21_01940 [Patescibacteria group bacterium]
MQENLQQESFLLEEEKEFERQYKVSMWWVEHRILLKKIGYGIIMAIEGVLLIYTIWIFVDTYAVSYDSEQTEVAKMVAFGQQDLHAYSQARAAFPIDVSEMKVFSVGGATYDYYALLTNDNIDWYAEFSYWFETGGEQTEKQRTFILPESQKTVAFLGHESSGSVAGAEIVVGDISWHRIDKKKILDYESWAMQRQRIEVSEVIYNTHKVNNMNFGTIKFSVENMSPFSYYDIVFYSILKRGKDTVGVNRITLDELYSGGKKDLEMQWSGVIPSVSQVEIVSDLNILDETKYIPSYY